LYYTELNDNGKRWRGATLFSDNINTLFNEGPVCFYNQGANIVFTRNLKTNKKFGSYTKANNTMGLFFAEYYDNKWQNIVGFEYNSDEYTIMDPAISSDGKILYFASNMPGTYGGTDIFVCKFSYGRWGKPENLGSTINTNLNEAFPFLHSSGRLYFSSQGWNSKGGYDIFFSQEIDGKWIHPQSMKEPFNSNADDFGFIADEYLQKGFFSSNRGKSDDIYAFTSVISEFENCKQQEKNSFCYLFYENGTGEGDVTGSMRYEWDLGDGTKVRALQAQHCFEKIGTYKIQLNVIDSLTGAVLLNQAEYDFVVEEIEQPFITAPEIANVGESIQFDGKKSNMKNFKIAKYYWDFGDGLKGIGENVSHVFYDEGVYDVKLQLESTQGRVGVKKACVYRSIVLKKQ
jgi:hypothetical protein